jgi:hypothetical protein
MRLLNFLSFSKLLVVEIPELNESKLSTLKYGGFSSMAMLYVGNGRRVIRRLHCGGSEVVLLHASFSVMSWAS